MDKESGDLIPIDDALGYANGLKEVSEKAIIQELVEKLKEDYHIKLDGTSFVLVRFTELDEIIKELESKK